MVPDQRLILNEFEKITNQQAQKMSLVEDGVASPKTFRFSSYGEVQITLREC